MDHIPIMIHGNTCGELGFRREGAYMMCRGQADWHGGMVRLWLYGKGEPGYLGVLQPDGSLRKRFSLADFSRLPNPIEYCSTEEQVREQPRPQENETETVLWVQQSDGTLLCRERGRRYLAFPADGVRLPRGCEFLLRRIEGRDYVIFPY